MQFETLAIVLSETENISTQFWYALRSLKGLVVSTSPHCRSSCECQIVSHHMRRFIMVGAHSGCVPRAIWSDSYTPGPPAVAVRMFKGVRAEKVLTKRYQ